MLCDLDLHELFFVCLKAEVQFFFPFAIFTSLWFLGRMRKGKGSIRNGLLIWYFSSQLCLLSSFWDQTKSFLIPFTFFLCFLFYWYWLPYIIIASTYYINLLKRRHVFFHAQATHTRYGCVSVQKFLSMSKVMFLVLDFQLGSTPWLNSVGLNLLCLICQPLLLL